MIVMDDELIDLEKFHEVGGIWQPEFSCEVAPKSFYEELEDLVLKHKLKNMVCVTRDVGLNIQLYKFGDKKMVRTLLSLGRNHWNKIEKDSL